MLELGVDAARSDVDHGLTGTNRDRLGLREALAACRAGDTLVVAKLACLARSLPDARSIAEDLTTRQVRLDLGGSVYDPTDPVGRLLFNVLAMVAEFEPDVDSALVGGLRPAVEHVAAYGEAGAGDGEESAVTDQHEGTLPGGEEVLAGDGDAGERVAGGAGRTYGCAGGPW